MSTDSGRLRYFEAVGAPYDLGVQLGQFGAEIAHGYLVTTSAWRSLMAFRGDQRVTVMRQLVEARFPAYWRELEGMAHGLELPVEEVFLWNCRGDVWSMVPDGCTTVQIPSEEPLVAHNEDGDPGLRGHCALAHVRPQSGPAFTAFVYPGSIPGHTFAVTERGLVQTVNNIRSRGVGSGVPRMLVGRAVLDCATLDDAIQFIGTSERAGSFHFTLAQRGDRRLFSIEFTHMHCSAVTLEERHCHANHLVHEATKAEPQVITGSSAARQSRGQQIIQQSGSSDLDPLSLLWDRSDPRLPVLRDQPDDPDRENTLATAILEVTPQSVNWRVYDRPFAPSRFSLRDAVVTTMPHNS